MHDKLKTQPFDLNHYSSKERNIGHFLSTACTNTLETEIGTLKSRDYFLFYFSFLLLLLIYKGMKLKK